jgi:hypothetical protein
MHDQKPPLIIYPSRVRMLFWAVMALAFVGVGVFIAPGSRGRDSHPLERFIVMYFGVPFFGIAFVHEVLTLIQRRPALIITDEGIFHNQGLFPLGLIRWKEVEDVCPCEGTYRIRVVRVALKDSEAIMARQRAITRFMRRTSGRKAAGRVDICDMGLPLSTEQIYSRMWEYMPEALKRA